MNGAVRRKLQALEHPQADTLTLDSDAEFRTLVKWAENRKIRFYAPEDRKALDSTDAPTWPAALQAYVQDLGGDVQSLTGKAAAPDTKVAREVVADWLLSYAVGMEYSDRADTLSKLEAAPAAAAPAHAGAARAGLRQTARDPIPVLTLCRAPPRQVRRQPDSPKRHTSRSRTRSRPRRHPP